MQETINNIRKILANYYPTHEIDGIIFIIFNSIFNYSKYDILKNRDKLLAPGDAQKVEKIAERLKQYEPIQYILGETEFFSLKFCVSPAVLIPRGETEELVYLIINENICTTPSILDIGTGSGCIAIALKKNIPGANVMGYDISDEALTLAGLNAAQNETPVDFFKFDILSEKPDMPGEFDIIVSNPPYVTLKEKCHMEKNVVDYEPHIALFVPDEDPLLFYRSISKFAWHKLRTGGKLYFEINEAFGSQTSELIVSTGFSEVKIHTDIHGKPRIVSATKR